MPEKVMIVAERKATSHRKATNITESDSASLVSEKSKLKESIQLRGNTALAEASRTLSDTSTLAFNEVDTSKNPIQIRGVSTLNDQVMNIPGVEVKTQSANEKTDNRLVASVQEETALNEVVVVGYGTQKKVDLTGSVAGLNTNQIEDKSASPAIGWVAFNKYLKAALLTPNIGSPKVKTVVRLSFVITKTGLMEQIKVLSSKDERYNEEAIRILKAGPGWNPEVKNQSLQSSEVTFRIVFEPKDKRIVK
jgi:TonB family protein